MEFDFHGYRLEDVDKIFDSLFQQAIINDIDMFTIITGTGVIKERIIDLSEMYECDAIEQLGNRGTLIILIDLF